MCAAIRAVVGNKIGWARFSQTVVDLGCPAKGSREGAELEGNPCPKSPPATVACVSEMSIF